VQAMKFDTSAAEAAQAELAAAAKANAKGATMDLVRTVGVILLVALVLLLAWRSMRKAARRSAAVAEPVDLRELELVRDHLQAIAPIDGGVLALDHAGLTTIEPTSVLSPVALPATAQVAQELEAEIGDLIDRQPEEVASLLRNWLAERRVRAR
jgi:flagellar M-ring protein FliF